MKTAYLKELGITDPDIIEKIMAENGRDIEKVKGDKQVLEQKIDDLENDVRERYKQIKELTKTAEQVETLTNRVTELENDNTKLKSEIDATHKDHSLELKIRDAKAKNIKAVKALIDTEKENIDEQIKSLVESDETKFLFDIEKPKVSPSGTEPSNGQGLPKPTANKTFADSVREALKNV